MSYTPQLKDREYYENLYDGRIVTQCRMIEECVDPAIQKALKENKEGKNEDEIRFEVTKAKDIHLYFLKGDLATKRNEKIEEWMKEHRDRDNFYNNARVNIPYCIHCNREMNQIMKQDFFSYSKTEKNRVLFMFECKDCKYRRGRWDNGEDYKVKRPSCEKCGSEDLKTEYIKGEENDIFRETCQDCHNIKDETFKNYKPEKEKIDPNYEKDREKYVLTEKETLKYEQWIHNLEKLNEMYKKNQEETETQEAVANIHKLDVSDMKDLIIKALKKKKYNDISFSNPVVFKRGVNIELSVAGKGLDKKEFQELIQGSLENTNWKINEKSILINLGILQCKLEGE